MHTRSIHTRFFVLLTSGLLSLWSCGSSPLPSSTTASSTATCNSADRSELQEQERSAALTQIRRRLWDLRALWVTQEPPQREWEILSRRADHLLTWIYKIKVDLVPPVEAHESLKTEIALWQGFRSPQAAEVIQLLQQTESWVNCLTSDDASQQPL